MNLLAFFILDKLNLRHPQEYKMEEIKKMPENKIVYLRFCDSMKKNNRMERVRELTRNFEYYQDMVYKSCLLQIAEPIISRAGSVILIEKDFIYGEYIEGELIGLLRRGMCARRFVLDKKNNRLYEKDSYQGWICKNENYIYRWFPYNGKISDSYEVVLDEVLNLKDISEENLLIEISVDSNNCILFSDARYRNMKINYEDIISVFKYADTKIDIKGAFQFGNVKIDGLDIDNCETINNQIIIYHGALLSHYITYKIDEIENLAVIV